MGRQTAVFAITHQVPVYPTIESRLHAFKVDENVHSMPLLGHFKLAHVCSHAVIVGRHERRIHREGIAYIGIDGDIEALQLPTAGHLDVAPRVHIETGTEETVGHELLIARVKKLPSAVKRYAPFGPRVAFQTLCIAHREARQSQNVIFIRYKMGRHGLSVEGRNMRILPRSGIGHAAQRKQEHGQKKGQTFSHYRNR